jgi:hypothetical protein
LVPSEHSSGPKRRMGGITKGGDVHARTLLIEAAHSYRFPARVARRKLAAVDAVPEAVRDIAWKAQTRLCQRYRHMVAKNKPTPVIVTAIARELAGFVWSIACITSDPPCEDLRRHDNVGQGLSDKVSKPFPRAPAVEGHGVPGANRRAHRIALRNGGPTMPRGRQGEHSGFAQATSAAASAEGSAG